MKILLCPDKFRGSLTAPEACAAMTEGIHLVSPAIEVVSLPMADGGEGTLDVLLHHTGGQKIKMQVHDPLGRHIEAEYGISADGQTAFIEMAAASGLRLLQTEERNPLKTSTFGAGELIKDALRRSVSNVILGIGGSATNDAGTGMAAALGWQFLDKHNKEISPCGENLIHIQQIIPPDDLSFPVCIIACDVTNPLYGRNGAAYVYGSQKGASPEDIKVLDEGLKHFSGIAENLCTHPTSVAPHIRSHFPGAGAAGGLGFGAMIFLNATLQEGVKLLMEQTDFERHLSGVDLVITGEGKIDSQTLQGKLIAGITEKAQEHGIPVAALCGTLDVSPEDLRTLGIIYAASVLNRPLTLQEALASAYESLQQATFHLVRLFQARKPNI